MELVSTIVTPVPSVISQDHQLLKALAFLVIAPALCTSSSLSYYRSQNVISIVITLAVLMMSQVILVKALVHQLVI